MKKKINKAQEEKLLKLKQERDLIKQEVLVKFPDAEGIGVEPEFKEVSFMVSYGDFDNKKSNFTTEKVSFIYEDCDNDMMSFKFKYKII